MMLKLPDGFLSNMRLLLGDEFECFLDALSGPPERALRLNALRPARVDGDIVPWEPDGRYVSADFRPGSDPAHFSGAYYMQDASAMAPARALAARPGELVLDLCAAPGGKAGQLAVALGGRGALVANEPDAARCRALAGNLERLGVRNSLVTCALPGQLARVWPETFDAILVDAPCSGEGMFRRDDEAMRQWSESAPEGCAARQAEILDQAARMLKPGGRIAYSTCTFNELENERTVRGFLDRHGEFEPLPFALPGVGESAFGMLRLWPHKLRGEGHFVALMRKSGVAEPVRRFPVESERNEKIAFEQLRQALPGRWSDGLDGWRLRLMGGQLRALPPELPTFDGLKALRTGLHLCTLGKGYLKPDHALAMAIGPGDITRGMELTPGEARRYMAGQQIACDPELSGWVWVCHERMPLGWGKAVQGAIKNHIPKGVRLGHL